MKAACTGGALLVILGLWTGSARADRREASLHAQVVGGVATLGDGDANGTSSTPLGGLAVRASYATHNLWQYDVALSLLGTGEASFPSTTFVPAERPAVTGPYTISQQVTRLDGGLTFRLGVAWIPTARVALGVQGRRHGGPVVSNGMRQVSGEADTGRSSEIGLDVIGAATVGLDHRINRRLIVGAAAGATVAVPLGGETFRSFEATLHASYYWYPR